MNEVLQEKIVVWKESIPLWLLWVFALSVLVFVFYDALSYMVYLWGKQEEYGHGFFIPALTVFFIWQQKDKLERLEFKGSWIGLLIILPGLLMYAAGELSALYVVTQYAFVVVLFGLVYAFLGKDAFKIVVIPLFLLFLMIPLPDFLYQNLSAKLQLISTELGVAVIRLMDISVFVEGNVIDLGVYQLQVVEACSGLNYLFPLMTLGFIMAYFFTGAYWKKAVIFFSTIPITIFMNSLRIGVIGITVDRWGVEMAEGFLHDFEGWAVFMSCIGVLMVEMWLLAKIGGDDRLPLREVFGLDFPEETPPEAEVLNRNVPKSFYAALAIVILVAVSVLALPDREEVIPDRKGYAEFPSEFNGWVGRSGYIEQPVLDTLKLTDYAMTDYRGEDGGTVNFYSAYYDSQKKGASAHSPRSCIPGGGWRIASLEDYAIQGMNIGNVPLVVNRLVIEKGEVKQLVYYWFQQRGRIITNEYMMKWYLFWDSITKSRTDGALIRLTTILNVGQEIEIADTRLESFMQEISLVLPEFVPQ